MLEENNFEVLSPRSVKMSGKSDKDHLQYATMRDAVVVTSDKQFARSARMKNHAGILIMYQYNDPRKDMSFEKIVRALQNIVRLGIELRKHVYKLNDFN